MLSKLSKYLDPIPTLLQTSGLFIIITIIICAALTRERTIYNIVAALAVLLAGLLLTCNNKQNPIAPDYKILRYFLGGFLSWLLLTCFFPAFYQAPERIIPALWDYAAFLPAFAAAYLAWLLSRQNMNLFLQLIFFIGIIAAINSLIIHKFVIGLGSERMFGVWNYPNRSACAWFFALLAGLTLYQTTKINIVKDCHDSHKSEKIINTVMILSGLFCPLYWHYKLWFATTSLQVADQSFQIAKINNPAIIFYCGLCIAVGLIYLFLLKQRLFSSSAIIIGQLILIVAIFATGSRNELGVSFLVLIFSVVLLLSPRLQKKDKSTADKKKKPLIMSVTVLMIATVGLTIYYQPRLTVTQSLWPRIYIWCQSVEIAVSNVPWGAGFGRQNYHASWLKLYAPDIDDNGKSLSGPVPVLSSNTWSETTSPWRMTQFSQEQRYLWLKNTNHAHNIFLQILAESGLIGLLLFIGVLIISGKISLPRRGEISIVANWVGIFSLLVIILAGLLTVFLETREFVWATMILVSALKRH